MVLRAVLTFLKDKKLSKLESDLTQKWSNSTLVRYLTTWNRIFSCSRTSASSCLQMPTCTRRTAGRLSLEWQSRVGEFAFRVTQGIIRILRMTTSLSGILPPRLLGKFSTGQSRQPATSLPTYSQSVIVRRTSAWWMARRSWKRRTKSPSRSAPCAFEKCPHISDLTARSWSYTLSWRTFLSWWIIMIPRKISGERYNFLTEFRRN